MLTNISIIKTSINIVANKHLMNYNSYHYGKYNY